METPGKPLLRVAVTGLRKHHGPCEDPECGRSASFRAFRLFLFFFFGGGGGFREVCEFRASGSFFFSGRGGGGGGFRVWGWRGWGVVVHYSLRTLSEKPESQFYRCKGGYFAFGGGS